MPKLKNIFSSTLRREIGRNWLISFEFCSLGIYTLSAIIHWLLVWQFFHANFRLACSHFRTLEHFLYSWKDIPFGPGVDMFLLLFIICLISLCVGSFILNSTLGPAGKTRLVLFSRGICHLGSEYIPFRYFSRRFFCFEHARFRFIKYVPCIFVWFLEETPLLFPSFHSSLSLGFHPAESIVFFYEVLPNLEQTLLFIKIG